MQAESVAAVGFGRVLRRYRVAAGLTQEALAERAGLSARGISDLERAARTRPYPATVRRLAQALGLGEVDQRALEMAAESAVPVDAASSRSFVAPAGMLPAPLSSFVGREREITEVQRLLSSARLVTLLGPGGIGKTRLAVEVATAMADHFADGVAFVALAGVRDAGLVIGAVAEALGIQETGGRVLMDRLHSHLQSSDLLLVLDNFEHLLPAAESVAWLLGNCPRLTVFATSRAPLRISGEREFAVQPLALPATRNPPPIEQLREYEAVRLFIERGLSVRPDLELTDERVRTLAEACARLDGLPLAIELAAARLRVLSPEMLLERLEHRLPVLVGGPRDAPARQRTLTAAIAWSYDLLDSDERRLFRQLSVFVGGFTLDAAEAVCGGAECALAIFNEIGDRYFIVARLIGLAEVAQATGGSREAVSLLAAGSSIMANMGASLWPSIRPYIERTADQARAVLGDAVFQQVWRSGSLLSVDQAVAMAMAVGERGQPSELAERFEVLLAAAQKAIVLTEDHSHWIDFRCRYHLHRISLEVGRRLAAAGVIDAPEDVFLLSPSEVTDTALELPRPNRRAQVAARRAEMEYFRSVPVPATLGTAPMDDAPHDPVNAALRKFFGAPAPTGLDRALIRGNSGSPGRARGPARVIRSLAGAGKLRPGDVLVVETTAPPWTPLFATAAAVVSDTGGILSHCAVVAREYGIPAVVGTGNATALLEDGQMVEGDGEAATVRVVG